jgi:HSP20 family protein
MAIRDLIPWKKESKEMIANQPFDSGSITDLRTRIDQMMDNFWNDPFDFPFSTNRENFLYPQIDLSETEKEFTIITDLPGLTENDIEILAHSHSVKIRGNKETSKEEKNRTYHLTERNRGSFSREISLSEEIDESKVEANIKNGVLTIHLPKLPDERSTRRRIPIKTDG